MLKMVLVLKRMTNIILYDPEPNIQEDHSGNYVDGQMDNDSSPKGFYIIFNKTNYGIYIKLELDQFLYLKTLYLAAVKVSFGFTAMDLMFEVQELFSSIYPTTLKMLRVIARLIQILLMFFLG